MYNVWVTIELIRGDVGTSGASIIYHWEEETKLFQGNDVSKRDTLTWVPTDYRSEHPGRRGDGYIIKKGQARFASHATSLKNMIINFLTFLFRAASPPFSAATHSVLGTTKLQYYLAARVNPALPTDICQVARTSGTDAQVGETEASSILVVTELFYENMAHIDIPSTVVGWKTTSRNTVQKSMGKKTKLTRCGQK